MDFIAKLSPSSGYTLILVIVDHLSKQSLFIPTHDTITTGTTLRSPHLLQAWRSEPCHLRPQYGICLPFFSFAWNGTQYEAALHFGISSRRIWTDRTNESDFGTVSPSLLQLPAGQLVRTPTISRVCIQQYPERYHWSYPLLCQQGLSSKHHHPP